MGWSDRWDQAWDQSLEENLGMHSHTEKSVKAGSSRIDQFRPFKGVSDPSHFIFEMNVGKSRIRHRNDIDIDIETTLQLNF